MKYLIVIERTNTGYSAYSPDLPGCVATGPSVAEVEENMRDAMAFHIDGMLEEGYEVPHPSSVPAYVEVPA